METWVTTTLVGCAGTGSAGVGCAGTGAGCDAGLGAGTGTTAGPGTTGAMHAYDVYVL